jgi:hypothetical protein
VAARLAKKIAHQWQLEYRGRSAAVTPRYGKISNLPPRPAQDFFSALSIAGLRKRR